MVFKIVILTLLVIMEVSEVKWKEGCSFASLLLSCARKRTGWLLADDICAIVFVNDTRKFYSVVLSEEHFSTLTILWIVKVIVIRNVMILFLWLHMHINHSLLSSFSPQNFFLTLTGRPISIRPISIGCVWMFACRWDTYIRIRVHTERIWLIASFNRRCFK